MLYADSCVIISLYLPEKNSAKASKILSGSDGIAICSLTEVEFNSAISRLVRMKELSKESGHQIISQFQLHLKDLMYTPLPISYKEFELARDWIGNLDNPLRTLDALQLAVSYSNDLTLVTADAALAKAAKTFGITVKKI